MKISDVIRTRRQALGLTQEALAHQLGVSTPAVNKWEKALNYPDITLLPALARVLGVDLNTLLSFQEDLTDAEIGAFLNQLVAINRQRGLQAAFQAAFGKLREFPDNDRLAYSLAGVLDGLLTLGADDSHQMEIWKEQVMLWYQRCAGSTDLQVREQAVSALAFRYMNQGNLEEADRLIGQLPDLHPRKQELLAVLRKKQGKREEAWKIWEKMLFTQACQLQTTLTHLLDMATEENDFQTARHIAEIAEQAGRLLGLGEYTVLMAPLQLAMVEQNGPLALKLLETVLHHLTAGWPVQEDSLYRHLPLKKPSKEENLLLQSMLHAMERDSDHDFLRRQPGYQELIAKYRSFLG